MGGGAGLGLTAAGVSYTCSALELGTSLAILPRQFYRLTAQFSLNPKARLGERKGTAESAPADTTLVC